MKYFSNMRKALGPGVDGWAVSLKAMMSIVVLMGLAICGLYWWVNTSVPLPTRSKKKKVSFFSIILCNVNINVISREGFHGCGFLGSETIFVVATMSKP